MKKGIRGHDVSANSIREICKKCERNGIEYLQLVLEKSVEGFSYGNFSEQYAKSLNEELGSMKLAILGSYINIANADDNAHSHDISRFIEKIKYASILKPIAVGTETGIYKNESMNDSEEAYERVLKTFKTIISEAEKYDVNIGIEGVKIFVINTPQKMRRLLNDIASNKAKVIFDPVNYLDVNNYKNQDAIIGEAFDLFADRMCAIHAKDFHIENDRFKVVTAMEGLLNYELIFKKMREHNVDIPIISEETDLESAKRAFIKMENLKM